MTAIARMAVLDLRTVAPYRNQGLLVFGLVVLVSPAKVPSRSCRRSFCSSPRRSLPTRSLSLTRRAWRPFTPSCPCPAARCCTGTTPGRWRVFSPPPPWVRRWLFFSRRLEAVPFGGRTLVTVLTLSWALFAVNVAIQFPLLIRFGYTRISVLGTTLPLAVVMLAVYCTAPDHRVDPDLAPTSLGSRRGRDGGVRGRGHHRRPAARALKQTKTRRPDRQEPAPEMTDTRSFARGHARQGYWQTARPERGSQCACLGSIPANNPLTDVDVLACILLPERAHRRHCALDATDSRPARPVPGQAGPVRRAPGYCPWSRTVRSTCRSLAPNGRGHA